MATTVKKCNNDIIHSHDLNNKVTDITLYETHMFRVIVGLGISDARPHLIMLFNRKNHRNYRMSIFDIYGNSRMFNDLVYCIDRSFKKNTESIWSVHIGQYQSRDSPHFHAHLVLPMERYTRIIGTFMNIESSENAEYRNRLNGWLNKTIEEGIKYKKTDLTKIEKGVDIKAISYNNINDVQIKWHSTQPRIGFVMNQSGDRKHDKKKMKRLVSIMLEFCRTNNLDDRTMGGCHLCLQNGYYVDDEFKDLVGYLQVDPVNYYRLNPDRIRWLDSYKNVEYSVIT